MVFWIHVTFVELWWATCVFVCCTCTVFGCFSFALELDFFEVFLAFTFEPFEVFACFAITGCVDDFEAVFVAWPIVLFVFFGNELGCEVHFADSGCEVAVLAEGFGEGDLGVWEGDAVIPSAVVLWVSSGDEGAAGWDAHGALDVVGIECAAVQSDAVNVGRVDFVVAVTAECIELQLICHHDENVWTSWC